MNTPEPTLDLIGFLKEQFLGKMFLEKLRGPIKHLFVPFEVKNGSAYEHGFTFLTHSLTIYNTDDESNYKHTDYFGCFEMDIPLDKPLESYSSEELLKKVMGIVEKATPEQIAAIEKDVNDNYKVATDFIKKANTL